MPTPIDTVSVVFHEWGLGPQPPRVKYIRDGMPWLIETPKTMIKSVSSGIIICARHAVMGIDQWGKVRHMTFLIFFISEDFLVLCFTVFVERYLVS